MKDTKDVNVAISVDEVRDSIMPEEQYAYMA